MTARGFGWLPELSPPLVRLTDHGGRLGLGLIPHEAHALIDCVHEVLDQGHSPSCVSQAIAQASRLRALASGQVDAPLPSRRWLHLQCRRRDAVGGAVVDSGTYISTACAVTRELGWPAEEHWPWSDEAAYAPRAARTAWLDDPPPQSTYRHAHDQRDAVQEYGVDTDDGTKAALAVGLPIVFGAVVDYPFLDCSSMDPVSFNGVAAGGHAMLAIGYDLTGVVVLNSWGSEWGVGGLCVLSWQCWRDQCRNKRAIESVRRATT